MTANNDSSCTQTYSDLGLIEKVTFDVIMDSGDGSFTDTALSQLIEGFLLKLETNPGSPAPDANYDITIENGEALDILETLGTNRHTTTTEFISLVSGTYFHPVVTQDETLTLKISGNTTVSAVTKINLIYSAASG